MEDVFSALSDETRRQLLVQLQERPRLDVPCDFGEQDSEVAIVHLHLPKLDEADLIEWDRESRTVERGPRFDELKPLLSAVEEMESTERRPKR